MVVAFVVVLAPSLAMMALPGEMWPWTCAPMFAANVDDRVLYRPRVLLERSNGEEGPYRFNKTELSERQFFRLLLVEAYGSADPSQPFGHVRDDDREKFRARLEHFFAAAAARSKEVQRASAMRLEVERVSDGVVHVVGRYSLQSRRFELP
jgi:hypothetical protein